jgi:hypothetical protein
MKKLGVILAILVALTFASCAGTGGGGGASAGGEPPFSVDLSTMTLWSVTNNPDRLVAPIPGRLRNVNPITRNWEDLMFVFPEDMPDVTKYSRITVTLRYFNAAGAPIAPRDGMGMIVLIYDTSGDWRGPAMGAGPNTPLKEMNVGGFSAMVSTARGSRVALRQNPQALLVQKAQDPNVGFIELTGIHFHNGNFEFSEEQPAGEGPEGS